MSYRPRLKPRAHQVEAGERLRTIPLRPSNLDVFALTMEMGTGKTKVILDEWGERVSAGDVKDLLVVAPAGSYRNWYVDQGPSFPSELRKQLDPALFDRVAAAGWISGGGVTVRRQLEHVLRMRDKRRPRALFINVEALSSVDKAVECAREFLEGGDAIMVIDESTRIKNWKSNRTEEVESLGRLAVARRIMTGLITPNSPMDLYSQFYFLDWRIIGFRSFYGYRARYAIMQNMIVNRDTPQERSVKLIVDYRHVEELQQKIAPYSFRKLKDECLDLPKKVYLPPRELKLTDQQRRIYLEMREFATARLAKESFVSTSMVITQRIRLDQILCGFVPDEEGRVHEIPELRTRELLFVLQECHGKAIIWTTHDFCVRRLAENLRREFGPQSVAQFWGANRSTRHVDEMRWKTDPACRWLIATQSAGGVGNNWQMAHLSCYFNNSDNLEHRLQSEDRVHRDGLDHVAAYQDFIARGTIDERKVENLRNKIDLATIVNGDNYREWLI